MVKKLKYPALAAGCAALMVGCALLFPGPQLGFRPYGWLVELTGPPPPPDGGKINGNAFSDGLLSVSFEVFPNIIDLVIQNNTPDSLYILWNNSSFDLKDGNISGITHSYVRFRDRFKPLQYSKIKAKSKSYYFIAPTSRVDWNGISGKWRSFPIFDGPHEKLVGKTFTMHLTFMWRSKLFKYQFDFRVKETKTAMLPRRSPDYYPRH